MKFVGYGNTKYGLLEAPTSKNTVA